MMDRRRFLQVAGGAAAIGGGTAGYACFVEPGWTDFSDHRLPVRPGAASPPMSIAHISDLHLEDVSDQHEEIAGEVSRRSPAVVVITGDSVDRTRNLPALRDFLALLPHATPKFAILGNWEYWGDVDLKRLREVYAGDGCELLVNRAVVHEAHGARVRISGVDDLVAGRPDLAAALGVADGESDGGSEVGRDGGPDGADYHILLAHCPAHRDQLAATAATVDLVLSGHTHGGQVQVLGWAPVVPRGSGSYLEGWYRESGPAMYVSRGVGTSLVPVRFGARPEVAFFDHRG